MLQQIRRDDYTPGQLLPIFNAWAVVDVPTPGTRGTLGGHDIVHARLHVNFFVRPGRQPTLHLVGDSDCKRQQLKRSPAVRGFFMDGHFFRLIWVRCS